MKFLLPLRRGLRSAWQHPKLVLLTYLVTLLPAALLGVGFYSRLAARLNGSLFAADALSGNRFGVWSDLGRAHPDGFAVLQAMLPLVAVAVLLLHVLLAAGIVESLLAREHQRERPFLLGVGRHGWRFLRSALWFAGSLIVLAIILGASMGGLTDYAADAANGSLQYFGVLALGLVAVLLFIPLDLGYDLSRVAAATHDEGRTLVGYVKAVGHALRHPVMLFPLWLFFSLLVVGLHLSYVAARASWGPSNLGEVVGLLVVQQVVFILAAFLRVGLWGGEVAYYQAVGEPRWCGRKERPTGLTAPARPAAGATMAEREAKTEPAATEATGAPAPEIDLTSLSNRPTQPLTPPTERASGLRDQPTETLRQPPPVSWADAPVDDGEAAESEEPDGEEDDGSGDGPERF